MRYFIDTEFIEDGKTIDLISIGVVNEDGDYFYAESSEVDWSKASQWVLDNVRPHLTLGDDIIPRSEIARELRGFISRDRSPVEFWGYYSDYDWVVVCQLFGTMMDLPEGWPMYCHDLRQWLDENGRAHISQPDSDAHNALSDAMWIANTRMEVQV